MLPNNLEHQIQVSRYFDLGQFLRAVATRRTPTRAVALRQEVESLARQWLHPGPRIAVDHGGHNSVTHRGEASADILDVYAKDIAGIVERELNNEDPTGLRPFLFATDPLEDLPARSALAPDDRAGARRIRRPDGRRGRQCDSCEPGGDQRAAGW